LITELSFHTDIATGYFAAFPDDAMTACRNHARRQHEIQGMNESLAAFMTANRERKAHMDAARSAMVQEVKDKALEKATSEMKRAAAEWETICFICQEDTDENSLYWCSNLHAFHLDCISRAITGMREGKEEFGDFDGAEGLMPCPTCRGPPRRFVWKPQSHNRPAERSFRVWQTPASPLFARGVSAQGTGDEMRARLRAWEDAHYVALGFVPLFSPSSSSSSSAEEKMEKVPETDDDTEVEVRRLQGPRRRQRCG
jgi:hypothetical protein